MQNVYAPNLSEEVFLIYEEEINPNDEEIISKSKSRRIWVKNVIEKKGNKLYVMEKLP